MIRKKNKEGLANPQYALQLYINNKYKNIPSNICKFRVKPNEKQVSYT